jgi:hypothetical protein
MATIFSDQPFAHWDVDRLSMWLHAIGLSMYVGQCRRWVKNGDQLLKASGHDLEKVSLFHPNFICMEHFVHCL